MLTSLEILLKPVSSNGDSLPFLGSLLQGVIMRKIDSGYADALHQSGLNPYSQFVVYDREKGGYVWKISTLNQEAKENILPPLLLDSDKALLRENEIVAKVVYPTTSCVYFSFLHTISSGSRQFCNRLKTENWSWRFRKKRFLHLFPMLAIFRNCMCSAPFFRPY